MADRHEEKYLITYDEYSRVVSRVRKVMNPDLHGDKGSYKIASVYFDDPDDNALDDKKNGNALHIKYRIRTYDGDLSFIRLERKSKKGIITSKVSAPLTIDELTAVLTGKRLDEASPAYALTSEMTAKGQRPVCTVLYYREAFVYEPLGIRVTFDTMIDRQSPTIASLSGDNLTSTPVLDRNTVIMEVKYGKYCPAFVRKICTTFGTQISVSKYALSRNASY